LEPWSANEVNDSALKKAGCSLDPEALSNKSDSFLGGALHVHHFSL